MKINLQKLKALDAVTIREQLPALLEWIDRGKELCELVVELQDFIIDANDCDGDCSCVVCFAKKLLAELEDTK